MKSNKTRRFSLGLFAMFAGSAMTSNAFAAGTKTPTNNQLLDGLIASAKTGESFVKCDDMLLSLDELRKYRGAQEGQFGSASAFYNAPLWPGGRVPYVFDAGLPAVQQDAFTQACREWEKHANLTFFPRTTETDYIRVYQDANGGSFSAVGKVGGKQDLSLASWAEKYTACHELAHALGVLHEQSRSDRDTYVTIDFTNVEAGKEGNFTIVSDSNNRGAYDFDSVMHYSQYSFPINGSKPTIICKTGYTQYQNTMGQRDHLSIADKKGMADIYGAPGAPVNDNFADAVLLQGTSGKTTGTNLGASRETGEPIHVTNINSVASVWYKWVAPNASTTTFNTAGSDYDTIMAVYTGTSLSKLTKIVSNDDASTTLKTSALSFEAKANTTYYIAVDGYFSSSAGQTTGKIALAWKQAVSTTPYPISGTITDDSGNPLSGVTVTLTGTDTIATTTSATGTYSFPKMLAGKYTITPSKTDTTFAPSSRSITLAAASAGNDFTGTKVVYMPQMSVSDVSLREGNSGNPSVTFTVSLSRPSTSTITASFATADGTATNGKDYTGRSGTLTFAPNTVIATVKFPVLADTMAESNENFFLNISNASGARIADSQGRATLVNDDSATPTVEPEISISDLAVREGDLGRSYATFTVTLSQPSASTVTVDFATSDGSAKKGSDYTARTGTVSFAPNTVTANVTVFLLPDTVVEGNETLFVNLSNPVGANLVDEQGKITIYNDDVVSDAPSDADSAPVETVNASPSANAS